MNKDRRGRIQAILDEIDTLRSSLSDIADEEQEAFDNLPEGLQGAERGQAIESCAEGLQEAVDSLQEAVDRLTNLE